MVDEQWAENNKVTVKLMTETVLYWLDEYDRFEEQAELNEMPQYKMKIEVDEFGSIDLDFVHSPSSVSDGIPLLFLQGWPGHFAEVQKVLRPLKCAGFHVVTLSLPGFGFSSCPEKAGFKIKDIALLMVKLMFRLGYQQFVVQGRDWDAMIAWTLAVYHPQQVMARHVNLLSTEKPDFKSEIKYTDFEERTLERHGWFDSHEFAYYQIQNPKPRTLGIALHHSPVSMLAYP